MLRVCIVGGRCSRPITAHLIEERSSFVRYHGQHARSGTRTLDAGADATSAAAGLKDDNVSEQQISEASISDARGCKTKDGPPSSLADITIKSHIVAKDSRAYDSNSTNEPEKLGTASTAVLGSLPFFQSYEKGGKRSTRHKAKGAPPLPAQHFRISGQPGTREGGKWNAIGAQQEREVDKPGLRVEHPIKDIVSQHSRNSQSQNNAFGADNQAITRRSRSARLRRREAGRNLIEAQSLPATDTIYHRLQSPRYTVIRPGLRPRKRSSTKERRPEEREETDFPNRRFHKAIRAASVLEIEEKLYHTAHHKPNVDGVQFMLSELIKVRNVQPQARHYQALILANCEALHGCAAAIHPILAEMEREKIGISASTLSAVLKVLSIHPDAQLLPYIIRTFSSQWITPSVTNTVHLILSLTRLNQFELAITHLEQLISTSPPISDFLQTPVPQYLYTTILYRLASPAIADHTAILHLLYLLHDNNLPVSNVCISYILDCAAEALHLDLTLYLWRSHVDTNFIIPNTGLCRNALLTAARSSNPELAEKVSRWLVSREERGDDGVGVLGIEELEMVREARGAVHIQFGQTLGEAAAQQTTMRIVKLGREEEVREEKTEDMRDVESKNQMEEEAQKGREAVAETENNDGPVEERDTEGEPEPEIQPRFVAELEKPRRRQRLRDEVSTKITEEKEEKMQQEREIDDEDDELKEDKTKGEIEVSPRYVASLMIHKVSPRCQLISETMREAMGEQEKDVDSEYKAQEQIAQDGNAGTEGDDNGTDGDDGAAENDVKSESEARSRSVRAGLNTRRTEIQRLKERGLKIRRLDVMKLKIWRPGTLKGNKMRVAGVGRR